MDKDKSTNKNNPERIINFRKTKAVNIFPVTKPLTKKISIVFCYCPLYALKGDCGGNYFKNNGIKDCSNCLIPHLDGGYEKVMAKIKML